MNDLIEFLRARLDEDERVAKASRHRSFEHYADHPDYRQEWRP